MGSDNFAYDYTPSPYKTRRREYVSRLITKGCSERKAWSVAFRRYP